jgi:predicted outer membrane repeat protein
MCAPRVRQTCERLRAFAALTRILLAAFLFVLVGPVSPARADTTVCGPITVDTTWISAGNNYIVTCDVSVNVGITLTIEPGVVVKFEPGTSLLVAGELIAQAAIFTSNSPTPAIGDWGQIFFTVTSEDAVFDDDGNYISGSIIQDSQIEWGGGGEGVNGEVEVSSASPFLDHNTIRYSGMRGVHAVGRSSDQKIVISRNSITGNARGGVYASAGDLRSNTISDNYCPNYCPNGLGASVVNSILTDNSVTNNSGYVRRDGAGIYASDSTLTNNTVSGNSGANRGGGIYASGGSLTGNTVTGNTLTAGGYPGPYDVYGGGIYATASSLISNTVGGNTATASSSGNGRGGGIYATLSVLTGNQVSSNTVIGDDAYGGGVCGLGSTIEGNTISGNTSTTRVETRVGRGGGVYAEGGHVSGNSISSNTAAGGEDTQGGGVYGWINAISENTVTHNSARRGGAIYSHQGTVASNTVISNTTSWTGSIYMYEGTALENTLEGNSAVNGGGLYGYNAVLSGNTVQNNTANLGAGILSTGGTVRGNTVTGNAAQSDGGGIYALTDNTVPSFGHGSGAYLLGAADFTYNSVLTNTASGGTGGGISISGQPLVQFNNLYGNQPYDVEVLSSDDVIGTLNYWGLSLCTSIPWQIYDGNDLPGRGILSYAPSLYSPVPIAQLDAPTDLEIDIGEDAVTLSWIPIAPIPDAGCRPPGFTDPDLVYRIWYSIGKPCGPYDGTGLPAGDSPIDAGEATSYLVNGQGPGDYYFVVAAHDYLDRESAFTNSVVWPGTGYRVFLPLTVRDW